jgi:hypothetical protein
VVAASMYPALEDHLLAGLSGTELAAGVCSTHLITRSAARRPD